MIYGIGPKALGEQIGVDDNAAAAFMETFKAKYTGMNTKNICEKIVSMLSNVNIVWDIMVIDSQLAHIFAHSFYYHTKTSKK